MNVPFVCLWASWARDVAVVLSLRRRLSHTHNYGPANSNENDELAALGIQDGIRAAKSSERDVFVTTKIQKGNVHG